VPHSFQLLNLIFLQLEMGGALIEI
jgi:hypothetical protein